MEVGPSYRGRKITKRIRRIPGLSSETLWKPHILLELTLSVHKYFSNLRPPEALQLLVQNERLKRPQHFAPGAIFPPTLTLPLEGGGRGGGDRS